MECRVDRRAFPREMPRGTSPQPKEIKLEIQLPLEKPREAAYLSSESRAGESGAVFAARDFLRSRHNFLPRVSLDLLRQAPTIRR
jgi:hypothetical protein